MYKIMATHDIVIFVEQVQPELLFRSWRSPNEIKHILDRKTAGHCSSGQGQF